MADNNNKDNEKQRKRSMADMYMMSAKSRILWKCIKGLRNVFGILVIGVLIFLLLSGSINQVKTGQSIVDYSLGVGRNVGNFLESLFTKESPLKVTEDGVYFKDADVPENSALENLPDPEKKKEVENDKKN